MPEKTGSGNFANVRHLQRELEKLKQSILALGAVTEGRVQTAVRAVESLDEKSAKWIMDSDYEIDEMEVDIEEECLKLLALYQPVAVDLRFIAVVIKINNDLERIGDEAANIAHRILEMAQSSRGSTQEVFDAPAMGDKVLAMLQQSLDALVHLDTNLANKILQADQQVDAAYWAAFRAITKIITENPHQVNYWINLLLVARHLERIADHATNVAEEVIYLVKGEVVRHMGRKSADWKPMTE
jgi:phosphate transport system protein